ncbi:MAG: response regulator transcription factor [Ardenticatenaceae bacterium]|nr:response regulator transcription factor [Ardenticatenaceae bacterium]
MTPLHLLLIADDPLARAGLAALLADVPDCEVVGQMSSVALTADFSPDLLALPDVIIWDMGWDPADVVLDWPDLPAPVVVLLADEEQATAVYHHNLRGILLRDMDTDKLIAAARAVANGLLAIEPRLAKALLPATNTDDDDLTLDEPLTPRELEVLQRLAEGLTNKAIAIELGISEHTIKFHVNAIMGKLHAQSRTEAVVRATRLGLILL